MPIRPHPIPNRALPATKGASIARLAGSLMRAPSHETVRLRASQNAGTLTPSAPPITKASEGSHAPVTSRKPRILPGCVIPEIISPAPNTSPARKAER